MQLLWFSHPHSFPVNILAQPDARKFTGSEPSVFTIYDLSEMERTPCTHSIPVCIPA